MLAYGAVNASVICKIMALHFIVCRLIANTCRGQLVSNSNCIHFRSTILLASETASGSSKPQSLYLESIKVAIA